MPSSKGKSELTIEIQVQPKASRDEVVGFQNGRLKIRVVAPPRDGRANEKLREIIAEALEVSKSSVQIIRGKASSLKTIRVLNISQDKFNSFMRWLKTH